MTETAGMQAGAAPSWPLPYARFRLVFEASRGTRLPPYPGSAWRGAFGWALRDLACVTGQPDCRGCAFASRCVYQRLFETARQGRPESGMTTHAPHPFVLRLPPRHPAELVLVDIHLFGEAMRWLDEVVMALARAGRAGVGGARNRLGLVRVLQRVGGSWAELPPGSGRLSPFPAAVDEPPDIACVGRQVRVELQSPLRIVRRGRPLRPEELTPRHFVHALYARVRKLARAQGQTLQMFWPQVPSEVGFAGASLRWIDFCRRSSRQGRRHPIGGIAGHFDLSLAGLEAAWPLLWHGQFLHVGKLTAIGHGGYRLRWHSVAGGASAGQMPDPREQGI